MIRHIEYNSNADVAYDTAFEHAATHGFGYFRIVTDYVDPMSFEQEILIKRIRNPFSVYLDPNSSEPDGSDAEWGFVFEDVSMDDYKNMYGDSEMAKDMESWRSVGDNSPDWATEKTCRIAEYFYKEYEERDIVLLSNKQVILKSEMPEVLPEGITVIKERKTQVCVVKWLKINAIEILEETEWLGKYIPIVPVIGDELWIDGEKRLEGIVRHAKDSQRMYNYWASSETETISLAPKAPYVGVEGQFEGHEAKWQTANAKNHAFLEYKPIDINGQMAPPPQRNVTEPPVMAITNARMQASEDLKATTGIYDAALGNRSNESSGIAITRRAAQAQTSNYHLIDNLSRSLRHAGRILVELIPKVYDTERAIVIIGEDDQEKLIYVNKVFEQDGEKKIYTPSFGKYDVTVSNGPSYATKRQEAVESMLALTQHAPNIAAVVPDLLVKNMDWQGADEIAERLRKTIPPELLDDGKQKDLPPEIKGQMQQAQEMIDALTEQLEKANKELEQKSLEYAHDKAIENERLRYKYAELETKMRLEMLKQEGQDSRLAFTQHLQQIDKMQTQDLVQNPEPRQAPMPIEGQQMGQNPSEPMQPNINANAGPTAGNYME